MKDLTGLRFGRLVVLKFSFKDKHGQGNWECLCDCGSVKIVTSSNLRGTTKSCGCLNYENTKKSKFKRSWEPILVSETTYGIPTTSNNLFYIDKEDYYKIKDYSCWIDKKGYARTKVKSKPYFVHRLIMNIDKNSVVDHIDHNKLNNRKNNLRICTQADNCRNNIKPKNNTTGIKGVTKKYNYSKYIAQISFNKKKIHIGSYSTVEEAGEAYKNKAKELFGEFYNEN